MEEDNGETRWRLRTMGNASTVICFPIAVVRCVMTQESSVIVLKQLAKDITQLHTHRMALKKVVKREKGELKRISKHLSNLLEAQKIAQEVAETIQQSAHQQIASVVSRCLSAVFGDDAYQFEIKFEQKRGKTEARLLFSRDGKEIDPRTSAGGGAVDVASFALRLVCLVLSRPKKRKLLVLDEPWKFLSAEYRPAMRDLVLSLSEEMDVQILMVTHCKDFMVGNVIEVE